MDLVTNFIFWLLLEQYLTGDVLDGYCTCQQCDDSSLYRVIEKWKQSFQDYQRLERGVKPDRVRERGMLGPLLIDLSSGEMATMLALIRNSEGRQSSKGEGRGWNYGGRSAVKSLWDVRGWGAGGFARPELKRHQEKERAITGWYLRDDTVSFQVLKYRK